MTQCRILKYIGLLTDDQARRALRTRYLASFRKFGVVGPAQALEECRAATRFECARQLRGCIRRVVFSDQVAFARLVESQERGQEEE